MVDLRERAVGPADFLVGSVRREVEQRVELLPVFRLRRRRHLEAAAAAVEGVAGFFLGTRVYVEFLFSFSGTIW
jgi:hypothetical protein